MNTWDGTVGLCWGVTFFFRLPCLRCRWRRCRWPIEHWPTDGIISEIEDDFARPGQRHWLHWLHCAAIRGLTMCPLMARVGTSVQRVTPHNYMTSTNIWNKGPGELWPPTRTSHYASGKSEVRVITLTLAAAPPCDRAAAAPHVTPYTTSTNME